MMNYLWNHLEIIHEVMVIGPLHYIIMYGFKFQPQELYNETVESRVHTMFFYADIDAVNLMVDIADDIEQLLDYCIIQMDGSTECLPHRPQILTDVDGEACIGLTADIFVDNLAWRQTLFDQYGAQSIDMETGAVAMVAETNNIPFIAFRSLSDLAGAHAVNTTSIIDIFFNVAVHNSITVLKEWIYYAYCDDGYVEPTKFGDDSNDSSESESESVDSRDEAEISQLQKFHDQDMGYDHEKDANTSDTITVNLSDKSVLHLWGLFAAFSVVNIVGCWCVCKRDTKKLRFGTAKPSPIDL